MTLRRYFGTDGVRGVAGEHPMTAAFATRLGSAATEAIKQPGEQHPLLVIGMDTRQSGPMLAHAVAAGVTARGGDVHWLGVMPSPGVSYLTRALNAHAGVVISASHNPYDDNGIKFFNHLGEKLSDEVEARIEKLLDQELDALPTLTGEAIGRSTRYRHDDGEYVQFLLANAPYLDGLRVGLDCANGASFEIAPRVFKQIGARLDVINQNPSGTNINLQCGSTHPDSLRRRVIDHELDVGVCFDGDADRAILIDRYGRLVTGDHILAICALSRGEKEVVATVMSNLGMEQYLAERGITLHRTKVGDRYVYEELRRRTLKLGGEQSGHLLFLDRAATGDGILTALQTLSAIRKSDKPLEEWIDEIPAYPQVLLNVGVKAAMKHTLIDDPEIRNALFKAEEKLAGEGRINLRPSGTEPLIRVLVEGKDDSTVGSLAQELADVVKRVSETDRPGS
ncbi:MAG: phosphoglucosamine mutase [Trueperaceae bacterium]|nr:MAG: phosphoglucosamine mutase [Trueperaceae bacterium]